MTRRLVCEGQCNGGAVQEFDSVVKNAGRGESMNAAGHLITTTLVAPYWLSMARKFRHTVHRWAGVNLMACGNCGCVRRFVC